MNDQTLAPPLTPQDFAAPGEVRFCPGCGDHGILKALRQMLAETGASPADTVFISGIGCAARMVYYLETYGFHTIHGRAAAVATGVKLANPALDVWIVGGDGDALAIGGNHLIHLMRRDTDCQYVLINNAIYGLTKGQASPTTAPGTATATTPAGAAEPPMNAARLALGAGARFVARSGDVMTAHLTATLARARAHRGAALVEVFQNCKVFADGAFEAFMPKPVQEAAQIRLEHGRPMVFAKGTRGLRMATDRLALEAVGIGPDGPGPDILIHNETDPVLAFLLAGMTGPDLPVAMGVLFADPAPQPLPAQAPAPGFDTLVRKAQTWTVP